MKLQEYDPNIKWAKQRVRLSLMMWKYKGEVECVVGGNCQGFSIFDTALRNAYESLEYEENRHGIFAKITLIDDEGNELLCEDDEEKCEDWLGEMVVGMEIIEQVEDK